MDKEISSPAASGCNEPLLEPPPPDSPTSMEPPTASEPTPEKTVRCRVCFEPMYPQAERCNECKSYQDWRRYFDFSAVILSLLVALISVVSALGPQILTLFSVHGSRMQVQSAYFTSDGLILVVENHGTKPGRVGIVNVVIYSTDPDVPWSKWNANIDLPAGRTTQRSVNGGSTVEMVFTISSSKLNELQTAYPEGLFWKRLYDETIRISVTTELWDYNKAEPRYVDATPKYHKGLNHEVEDSDDEAFWQGYTTILQVHSDS